MSQRVAANPFKGGLYQEDVYAISAVRHAVFANNIGVVLPERLLTRHLPSQGNRLRLTRRLDGRG